MSKDEGKIAFSNVSLELESANEENGTASHSSIPHGGVKALNGEDETGVAFSGGGIRSAALCSGVLRRLLQKRAKIDYLSCVSGGGYTGTAYLDWKYRHENKDDASWHQQFFDNMRDETGFLCNWNSPLRGCMDATFLVYLVVSVNLIEPVVIWGSYACPVAFIVDFLFGKLLRNEVDCDAVEITGQIVQQRCLIRQGTDAFATLILFVVLGILFTIFFILAKKVHDPRTSARLSAVHTFVAVILAFTLLPYIIHNVLIEIPRWTHVLVVFLGVIVWASLPLLRHRTSYVLIFYFYTYVVYWKVYEEKVFNLTYSDELFNRLLFASGFFVWIVPLIDMLHKNITHVFSRWRLQKAFYSKESLGLIGCAGIRVQDICPLWTCFSDSDDALSLENLRETKPTYISNVVVNHWRSNSDAEKYELLTMSPTTMERLDGVGKKWLSEKLKPKHFKLSDAMATSAAAISSHTGSYEEEVEGLLRLQTILGLEMGTSLIADFDSIQKESWYMKLLPWFVQLVLGLPLISVPALYYSRTNVRNAFIAAGVLLFFVMHVVLGCIAVLNTTADSDQRLGSFDRIARWFIVHVPFVNFIRQIMGVVNEGHLPPPILLLSDGGHIENLGILPLLKRKLKRIVVVDGGYTHNNTLYGKSVLKALQLARVKLGCSFTTLNDRDVITDLLENFVSVKEEDKPGPRLYRFKVRYRNDEEGGVVKEGEVLLLKPRHPNNDDLEQRAYVTRAYKDACGDDEKWGDGPYLYSDDVNLLTFCCCDCCHVENGLLKKVSDMLCNVFPFHITANQFFTSSMFVAYHREGYRTCADAKAAEFLKQ